MEFRKFVYPAPLSSYTILDPDLIWISKRDNNSSIDNILRSLKLKQKEEEEKNLIPAFFIPYIDKESYYGSPNLLIYFHANGEDLGICYELMTEL